MKNINLMKTNLFMHVWYSIFRVNANGERFGADWHNWEQIHLKKIWKRYEEIKYVKSSMPWILFSFLDLIISLHIQDDNPNARQLSAALRNHIQTWKILQESQYWKLVFRSIQASILVLSASSSFTERVPIKNINPNAKNW